jgi:hypothetical protein
MELAHLPHSGLSPQEILRHIGLRIEAETAAVLFEVKSLLSERPYDGGDLVGFDTAVVRSLRKTHQSAGEAAAADMSGLPG